MSHMKNRTTYKVLTWCSWFFPINRFYIGDTKGIVLRGCTLNLVTIGWFKDLFYMDKTFDEAMAKRGYVNTVARNKEES